MGANGAKVIKERGDFVKSLLKKRGMTQLQLALAIPCSQENLSSILSGKRSLSIEMAKRITSFFPGAFTTEWLLGLSDYKSNADHLSSVVNEINLESDLLLAGLSAFAQLSGYEVTVPDFHNFKSTDEYLQKLKCGYIIKHGEDEVRLSAEEFNRFENEVYDFVKLQVEHLFKRKGGESK